MNLTQMSKALSANTNLSHYCILSKLGAGGWAEVYLAQDRRLDRKVRAEGLAVRSRCQSGP